MAVAEYANTAFESVKKFFNELDIKKWAENVGGSSAEAVEAAIYFGLCFAIGFLFKKYFKMLFVCIIISLFMIKALEYGKFLTIDWAAIKAVLGMSGTTDANVIINHWFDWIKGHLLLFISSVVGFLVGYKLG